MKSRIYLDWNATAPLRPQARKAMQEAMDVVGNPSSVHWEGRQAQAIVETARAQVAEAFGALGCDIVFTSGATEAAALAMNGRALAYADVEHDAIAARGQGTLAIDHNGQVTVKDPAHSTLQLANSETGIMQELPANLALSDMTQAFGKVPVAFNWTRAQMAMLSAHKLGGPKGVGALVLLPGAEVQPGIIGGGQEMGRRSGTENIIGIAGFGAAAVAASHDLQAGAWEHVENLRNLLENTLESGCSDLIFFGRKERRLPNTSCFALAGWKAETQVMIMDLAGFAISAGAACSSGKVRSSRVIKAMGYDKMIAQSAIRVSLGPTTKQEDVLRFAQIWLEKSKAFRSRAA